MELGSFGGLRSREARARATWPSLDGFPAQRLKACDPRGGPENAPVYLDMPTQPCCATAWTEHLGQTALGSNRSLYIRRYRGAREIGTPAAGATVRRKRALAKLLRKAPWALHFNEHIDEPGDVVFKHARWGGRHCWPALPQT
jgi:hypothetical protein